MTDCIKKKRKKKEKRKRKKSVRLSFVSVKCEIRSFFLFNYSKACNISGFHSLNFVLVVDCWEQRESTFQIAETAVHCWEEREEMGQIAETAVNCWEEWEETSQTAETAVHCWEERERRRD